MSENQNKEKKKKKLALISGLVLALTVVFIGIHQFAGEYFQNKSYNYFMSYVGGKEKKASKDVVLLMIDEASLAYGQNIGVGRWPWARYIYPELLGYLNSVAPPKAIFFDILFSESDASRSRFFTEKKKEPIPNDIIFAEGVAFSQNVYQNVLLLKNEEKKVIKKMPNDMFAFTLNKKDEYGMPVKSGDPLLSLVKKSDSNEYTLPIPCLRTDLTALGLDACTVINEVIIKPNSYETIDFSAKNPKKKNAKIRKQLKKLFPSQKKPPNTFKTAAGVSVASFEPDSDGMHRRGHILFRYDDLLFPSMSLAAVHALADYPEIKMTKNKIQVGKYDIPLDEDGNYMVNYYIDKDQAGGSGFNNNRVRAISASGLMESAYYFNLGEEENISIKPDEFKDKVVIIGCSAVACEDLKNSPISETTPGPEIHANIISNIMQGNHIIQQSDWMLYIIVLAIIFLCVASVNLSRNPYIQFGLPVFLFALTIAATYFLFNTYNYMTSVIYILTCGATSTFLSFGFLSLTEGAEKRKFSKILGNMIDPSIVSEALNDMEALKKGGEQNITAFFSDVAGFSTISEKLTSAELASLLNEYLSAMTLALKAHYGTLDKYIGDAIVGIFGAPLVRTDNAIEAARASVEMRGIMKDLHKKWNEEQSYCQEAREMEFRIGLNTGIAKVGFMGTDNLASYTMMGDTVNLAARLEAAGKDYGVDILISESTKLQIESEMFTKELDAIVVKGKTEPVKIFEIVGIKGQVPDNLVKSAQIYEEALELHKQRKFTEAIDKFNESQKIRGSKDKSALMLIERCEMYMESPPPENWNGEFVRTHK